MFNHTLHLNPKQKRMVDDDDFFDVSKEEVATLIHRMSIMQSYTRADVIRMRIKYDAWIDDEEKRFMIDLGLNYADHVITKGSHDSERSPSLCSHTSRKTLRVDGYTATEWKMLTDENYVPYLPFLTAFLNDCKTYNDVKAFEILTLKYRDMLDARDQKILKRHDISNDAQYSDLSQARIDGMTFYRWKLLNDDSFVPSTRGVLLSTIKKLRDEGYDDDAETIEKKYMDFLYPKEEHPELHELIHAAREYFRTYYPYSFKDE